MSQLPPQSHTSACSCSPLSFGVPSPQDAGREEDLCRRSTAGAASSSNDERCAPSSNPTEGLWTPWVLRREPERPSTPSSFGVPSPADARSASTPTIGVNAPMSETSLKQSSLLSKCCPDAPLGAEEAATAILEAVPDERLIKEILVGTV